MYMSKNKPIPLFLLMLLLFAAAIPVHADSVHKWVDAQGITHYSDQLPDNYSFTSAAAQHVDVTQITITDDYRTQDYQNDYYSVTNQWARMREERIARKQLQLEKAKQKKSLRSDVPQVVYINPTEESRSNSFYYPVNRMSLGHRNYGYKQHNYRHFAGKKHFASRNERSCRLPRRGYSRYAGSGLSLTIR